MQSCSLANNLSLTIVFPLFSLNKIKNVEWLFIKMKGLVWSFQHLVGLFAHMGDMILILSVLSHYYTDQNVAVTRKDREQCSSKGHLVKMDMTSTIQDCIQIMSFAEICSSISSNYISFTPFLKIHLKNVSILNQNFLLIIITMFLESNWKWECGRWQHSSKC